MSEKTPIKIRVIYADTDAMGIVYHTNYLRWFEIGRNELFRDLGICYANIEREGYNLPLTQVFCHYLQPARYDDVVLVETEVEYVKWVSIKFTYTIWDELRRYILVEGYTVHACTDKSGKIVRLPKQLAGKIQKIHQNC